MIFLLLLYSYCFASFARYPSRSVISFPILPSGDVAVRELRLQPIEVGRWGELTSNDLKSLALSTLHRFIVMDDTGGEETKMFSQTKRVTLLERFPQKNSDIFHTLGYVESILVFEPTYDQPYLVYHFTDAICGENLRATIYNPWLLSYAIASHELEKSERQSYHLILSWNTKSNNVHFQNILARNKFKGWNNLDDRLKNLTSNFYQHQQFFFPLDYDWQTYFYLASV